MKKTKHISRREIHPSQRDAKASSPNPSGDVVVGEDAGVVPPRLVKTALGRS
jgi:hypothetical protein